MARVVAAVLLGTLGLLSLAPVGSQADPPALPLRINCGGDSLTAPNGIHYVADTAYPSALGYGHVSGDAFEAYRYLGVGGTRAPALHRTERVGDFAYLVDLPRGRYVVTLRLASMFYHGEQLGIFDVRADTTWVVRDVDLAARAPRCYAQDVRVLVATSVSPLRIDFRPSLGVAEVAAIEIAAADALPPPQAVQGLRVQPAPGGILVHWDDRPSPSVAYFETERAPAEDGAFESLSGTANLTRHHWDATARGGDAYRYRVSAIDVTGVRGPATETAAASALPLDASQLPAIHLDIDPDSLRAMLAYVHQNRWVPAEILLPNGANPVVETRVRGGVSREFQKKSFKVHLPDDRTYLNRSTLNVIWKVDPTYIRESLAYGLFRQAGIPAANSSFCHLILNGTTAGVYLTIEQIDDEFLGARGMHPEGSLYKVSGGNMTIPESPEDYPRLYEKKTGDEDDVSEVIALVELVNHTSDADFPTALWGVLDVEAYLEWYALIILMANRDVTRGNHYLYLPPEDGRWTIFPWDNDLAFPRYMSRYLPLDMGAEWSEPMVSGGPNRLTTRILEADGFRHLYGAKLSQFLADLLRPEQVGRLADSLFAIVRTDGMMDRMKVTWEDNEAFLDEFDALKTFVDRRAAYVADGVGEFLLPATDLRINEICLTASPGWIEIRNAGEQEIATTDLAISNRPIAGTARSLPFGTIAPGEHHVVSLSWLDQETGASSGTRCLVLWRRTARGDSMLDLAAWPRYLDQTTLCRSEDTTGGVPWHATDWPTPGLGNAVESSLSSGELAGLVVWPCPSTRQITIRCARRDAGHGRLALFDVQGRRVCTLREGGWDRGWTRITWDGRDSRGFPVAAGTYFLRLTGSATASRRIVWLD